MTTSKTFYGDVPLVFTGSLPVAGFDYADAFKTSFKSEDIIKAYTTPVLVDPKCTYAFHYYEDAWSSVTNNITEIKALNPQTGQTSYSLQTSSGSFFGIDEKGSITFNAKANPDKDLTAGSLTLISQSATRLEVGQQLAIHVNKSGKHQEDASGSNSKSGKQREASYPAFSINVDNGGLNITCENGNIAFLGKNITMSATETITMSANKTVSLLAAFNPSIATASEISKAAGGPPVGGGGEVIIKAGKFTNNSASIEQTATTSTKQISGAGNFQYVTSAAGIQSINAPGDFAINASGNLDIQAGQKMRIQAQNNPLPAGISIPSAWAITQKSALSIISNQFSPPMAPGFPAISVTGFNGDMNFEALGTGNVGISSLANSINISAGAKLPKGGTDSVTDIKITSKKDVTVSATGSAKMTGATSAELGAGASGSSATFYKAEPSGLSMKAAGTFDVKAAAGTMSFSSLDVKGGGNIKLTAGAIALN